MSAYDGQRAVVMGLGRFGGGAGAARWLAEQGADVLVTDLAGADQLASGLDAIADLVRSGTVTLRLGEHNVSDFTDADLVIANPGVPRPWENRFLRAAAAAGACVTTEIGLLVHRLPARTRTIGVTGTAGKSTTVSMVAHVLRAAGHPVHLGGNIGGSLLSELGRITPDAWVVLELSSAQLHWIAGWSPHVAIVTNVASNHVDWHGTQMHYEASKRRIVASQQAGDAALLGPGAEGWALPEGVERLRPASTSGLHLRIPGDHNVDNAAMAIGACERAGVDPGFARRALADFPGLPHRLQVVAEHDGVRFVNDSKSTTPEAAALAIHAFDPARVRLIAGGYDKRIDLSPLADAARACASVHPIGATAPDLAAATGATPCDTLDAAFAAATALACEGDVILLSPGCASWDQFANYEERGRRFEELTRAWTRRRSSSASR